MAEDEVEALHGLADGAFGEIPPCASVIRSSKAISFGRPPTLWWLLIIAAGLPAIGTLSIKLGIDAHAKWYYVARQLDGATPQPVQKMDFEGLLHFVARQKRLAREVHT